MVTCSSARWSPVHLVVRLNAARFGKIQSISLGVGFSLFGWLISNSRVGRLELILASTSALLGFKMPNAGIAEAAVQKGHSNTALVPVVPILQAFPVPCLMHLRS